MFSDGRIIDVVLKQRLENKLFEWSKEINTLVSIKPNVIIDKDPMASTTDCTYTHILYLYQNNTIL